MKTKDITPGLEVAYGRKDYPSRATVVAVRADEAPHYAAFRVDASKGTAEDQGLYGTFTDRAGVERASYRVNPTGRKVLLRIESTWNDETRASYRVVPPAQVLGPWQEVSDAINAARDVERKRREERSRLYAQEKRVNALPQSLRPSLCWDRTTGTKLGRVEVDLKALEELLADEFTEGMALGDRVVRAAAVNAIAQAALVITGKDRADGEIDLGVLGKHYAEV